ncbi:MAG: phosphoethanolamine--lipid A transferase [Desulfobacterales bacterium]
MYPDPKILETAFVQKKVHILKSPDKLSPGKLILLSVVFLILFDNLSFFIKFTDDYPVTPTNIMYLFSVGVVLASLLILLFTLFRSRYTTKPILILIMILSSIASYFMNDYSIVIDSSMIQNIVQTNARESMELFNFKLFLYFLFLGVLPSILIYTVALKYGSFRKELLAKLKIIGISLIIIISILLTFGKFYMSFFREHKPLKYYINPTGYLLAAGKYLVNSFGTGDPTLKPIGTDATIQPTDADRELIILVVGEAVRADHLSLNGYTRQTTPLLQSEDIVNFPEMYSCGTSTAVSVPCMFSIFRREDYSDKISKSHENLLDVLHHAGVNILWRDNNSDSKGTALRVPYEDYKSPSVNPICDDECRDEGMLVGLQEYIDRTNYGDILIVLHQMGNHGPAYFKRYPSEFEKFTPVCKTNQLENCSREEIGNAYDNAVLYTDYFLSKVISLLKQNEKIFESAMVYISDHGESIGENNLYLHGLPYFMAPDSQKHVGAVMWFGNSFKIDKKALKEKSTKTFSQDYLFHTILGLLEVDTSIYDKTLDILSSVTKR